MKRLIEMDFPIFEVSEQSAREKSIRHGHISTLHIWWARRPLAACRAAIFASLVPTPAGMTERIPEYIGFLLDTLPKADDEKDHEWDGLKAHKRLVKFTADISPWEAAQNKGLIDKARKIIAVGKAVIDGLRDSELQEVIDGKREVDPPKVLDPFAGGGSIPLEALRLGCEARALEYNPVAVLILKATLEYPQKYGKKLVEDVKKWGNWVLEEARKQIGQLYPEEGDASQGSLVGERKSGGWVPVGYIWARTMICQNPSCGTEIPLMRQFWLRRGERGGEVDWSRSVYLRPVVDRERKRVGFEIVEGKRTGGFDPSKGMRPTVRARATFICPVCNATYKGADLRKYGRNAGFGHRMIAVVLHDRNGKSKRFRLAEKHDADIYQEAADTLEAGKGEWKGEHPIVPDENLPTHPQYMGCANNGLRTWGDLFNARQLLSLSTFAQAVRSAHEAARRQNAGTAEPIATYLGACLDRVADYNSSLTIWAASGGFIAHTFGRQALPMIWDYVELNPFSGATGGWRSAQEWVTAALGHCLGVGPRGEARQGDASRNVGGVRPQRKWDIWDVAVWVVWGRVFLLLELKSSSEKGADEWQRSSSKLVT